MRKAVTKHEAIRILQERGQKMVFFGVHLTANSTIHIAVNPEWVLTTIQAEPDDEEFYVWVEEGVLRGARIVVGAARPL